MYKKTMIASGIAMAVAALPVMADGHGEDEGPFADFQISGELKNESAFFTESGTTIGAASAHDSKDIMKSESSLRLFINGAVGEDAEVHAELRPNRDSQAVSGSKGHDEYTQRDFLRELYVDTTVGEDDAISLRIGKQQVVWGTADGMKLLDAINPTDYSEMAQNQMEDSRIPVWMITGEKDLENGSNVQLVISQAKSNFIPGLSTIKDRSIRSTTTTRGTGGLNTHITAQTKTTSAVDQGQPFMMKGVDSISGASNGIINVVPELAEVAKTFSALGAAFTPTNGAAFHLENWSYATVEEFVNNTGAGANFGGACGAYGATANVGSAYCLQEIADNTNEGATNLLSGMTNTGAGAGEWDQETPDTAFEYMPDATFKTFATFANASSKYVREGNETGANAALRYKGSTESGINYSLNYMSTNDPNPHIELEWQNAAGQKLTPSESIDTAGGGNGATGYRSIVLTDPDGNTNYGSIGGSAEDGTYTLANPVTLVLKEKNAHIHNLGGSFDTAIETDGLGTVVLRGEGLYQKDVMTPIVDKAKMSIGNITEAFTAQKGDKFKYVLGADITVLTNMMVSAQFIQDRNLDYVDTTTTLTNGQAAATNTVYDTDVVGARYTADMPTMAMGNQYQKAEKNKEFYSLFFSKPFGAEQQHRWNNIFMFEENGGKWNRFDMEYSFNDELIGTAEYNKYWGDANTQFGQLEASSNFQLGLKYIF